MKLTKRVNEQIDWAKQNELIQEQRDEWANKIAAKINWRNNKTWETELLKKILKMTNEDWDDWIINYKYEEWRIMNEQS
jgi:anaerobic ribonucleoside-triphosphate reductase